MSEQTSAPIDKSTWGDGPWQTEVDRQEWEHVGLPCLANRNHDGVWCGYVAVPPGHPLHGIGYSEESDALKDRLESLKTRVVTEADFTFARMISALCGDGLKPSPNNVLDVHGGLTYSGLCHGSICHVPKPGEPDDVFWFGFDCGHASDFSPGMAATLKRLMPPHLQDRHDHEVYRDIAYVVAHTNRLAEQLRALATA